MNESSVVDATIPVTSLLLHDRAAVGRLGGAGAGNGHHIGRTPGDVDLT